MQFFQLPREIRDLIHKHTFRYVSIDVGILELLHHDVGRRKHCLYYDQPAPIMDHALALLCFNHQVAAEAAFILYSKSTFTGCPCGIVRFLLGIGAYRNYIKSVTLQTNFPGA